MNEENDISQVHDIFFKVEKIYRGSMFHQGLQRIMAREVMTLDIQMVREMLVILNEYDQAYQEGRGPLQITAEGQFTR